mmetsp:Transcript_103087/g.332558  ORF Transcript_103087/g.332558 Transcript_103087/m.332558 type:complete len:208 (-) Transcript_103087:3-626(-)
MSRWFTKCESHFSASASRSSAGSSSSSSAASPERCNIAGERPPTCRPSLTSETGTSKAVSASRTFSRACRFGPSWPLPSSESRPASSSHTAPEPSSPSRPCTICSGGRSKRPLSSSCVASRAASFIRVPPSPRFSTMGFAFSTQKPFCCRASTRTPVTWAAARASSSGPLKSASYCTNFQSSSDMARAGARRGHPAPPASGVRAKLA